MKKSINGNKAAKTELQTAEPNFCPNELQELITVLQTAKQSAEPQQDAKSCNRWVPQ